MTAPMAMQQAPQMQAPVAQQPTAPAENVTTETKVTL